MSHQNPQVEAPPPPSADEAIQPHAPDFIETPEVAPLSDEREPLPIWLYLLCGFALFLTGSSFTGFGSFGLGLLDQGPGNLAMAGAKTEVEKPATPMELGKKLYLNNCKSCHGDSGEGAPGKYPPLGGSEWVCGSKERLAALVLAGVSGPITVKGTTYGTLVMPGWAPVLSDERLADIMTYARASWGNTDGPVKADEVAAARAKFSAQLAAPLSEADLLKIAPHGPDPTDTKP